MSYSYYVCRSIFEDMQIHLINVSIASLKYDNFLKECEQVFKNYMRSLQIQEI